LIHLCRLIPWKQIILTWTYDLGTRFFVSLDEISFSFNESKKLVLCGYYYYGNQYMCPNYTSSWELGDFNQENLISALFEHNLFEQYVNKSNTYCDAKIWGISFSIPMISYFVLVMMIYLIHNSYEKNRKIMCWMEHSINNYVYWRGWFVGHKRKAFS